MNIKGIIRDPTMSAINRTIEKWTIVQVELGLASFRLYSFEFRWRLLAYRGIVWNSVLTNLLLIPPTELTSSNDICYTDYNTSNVFLVATDDHIMLKCK